MSGEGDNSEGGLTFSNDFTPGECMKNWADRLYDIEDHDERERAFNAFYSHIWDLLFGPGATDESQARAVELLVAERPDAAFLNPFLYNNWIRKVKQEVIKRGLTELWKREFIPKQLGLIWARDSDYFDDMDDPEPALFYKLRDSE